MVRSSSSCFKVIACGSDSVDKDDLERAESKGSIDKRGWSFRKKSSKHRVLSNTVISESPSAGSKESPESTTIDFHAQAKPPVPEKISVSQWTDETTQLSTAVNSKVSDNLIAPENASKIDVNPEESIVIVIQAAIRGILARRALLKLKNVVKLQAAVRGHLVRRQATGTLRCVQAIIKMQALVRARRARLLEGSVTEEKLDVKHEEKQNVKPLGKENSGTKAKKTYSSTEKLLSNGFARQLLESTPKTKPIHIKCDPSKHNSSWNWLERWMSVSSSDFTQPQEPELSPEHQEQGEKVENAACEVGTKITAVVTSESSDLKSSIKKAAVPLEGEDNLITYDADNFDFQACCPTSSSLKDDLDEPRLENAGMCKEKEISLKIDALQKETEVQPDAASQTMLYTVHDTPEMESEQPNHTLKEVATEQLETEGKKFVPGSRRASNPTFVAAHSKFEELSSTATSVRPINSTCEDVGVESNLDTVSSPADSVTRMKEPCLTENAISHDSRVQVGGSECGTELSITSTLDSPDRAEIGGVEFKHETKVMENETSDHGGSANASKQGKLDVETKDVSSISLPYSSHSVSVKPGKLEDVNRESWDSVVAVDFPQAEQQPERSASDVQMQLDTVTDQQAYGSSPEASPRSHITVPESHGTPSSQVSVKAKKNTLDKSGSKQNRKSLSAGKRSALNPNHDSGARSSTEQLPKDLKNGKRRNSFGSASSDHVDQEPRDSSSSSLPSYMQATESARLKAHANNSPRSSPDVQDKDIYTKKRHSLPGTNGKQGSPRIQRSMSQAQQGAKGNGTHSPHGNF
ncbi:hypothetical protein HHK36_003013 [Tetracentron sinense]|uniref:DUF4005 domain-containing protein n=1 Tax=Tetracentron sinense TaxID=13715 RepID=A0A834ZN18_TETSI|nr:hypothetical protein HHK36_003013 [Tetracentron sinense]